MSTTPQTVTTTTTASRNIGRKCFGGAAWTGIALCGLGILSLLRVLQSPRATYTITDKVKIDPNAPLPTHVDKVSTLLSTAPVEKPLNLVILYADDWTMKTLEMYNSHVKTPRLRQLAQDGMMFDNNCVTTSICWISRATFLTGQYATRHEQMHIGDNAIFRDWNNTLFPVLKNHGYYTGFIGKWHAPGPPKYMQQAWHERNNYYGNHWFNRNSERRHVTDLNKEDSLAFLRSRPQDKPFALWTSFFATHAVDGQAFPMQYQPMNESDIWYDATKQIPNAVTNTPEHWAALPYFLQNEASEHRARWKNRFDTPERYQVSIRNLFRMASEVDAACGAIIDKLKAQGVYNSTMIVFTTDNGYFQGDHGMSDKWYAFEESIKVPLIVYDPRMPAARRGSHSKEYTLSIDLAPTLLAAARLDVPSTMQGRDIAELYLPTIPDASALNWRQYFFYEWNMGDPVTATGHDYSLWIPAVFALVEKEYKYIRWPQVDYEQLYHVAVDPFEQKDIFNETMQTNSAMLEAMKLRYSELKVRAQNGDPV